MNGSARVKRKKMSLRHYTAQEGRCFYCGVPLRLGAENAPDGASLDRIVPGARGGKYTYENTLLACRTCDGAKGSKSWATFVKKTWVPKWRCDNELA